MTTVCNTQLDLHICMYTYTHTHMCIQLTRFGERKGGDAKERGWGRVGGDAVTNNYRVHPMVKWTLVP